MSYRNHAARPRKSTRKLSYPRCLGIAAVALAATACDDPRNDAKPLQTAGVPASSFSAATPPPPPPTAEPTGEVRLGGVAPVPFEANSAK